MKRLLIITVPVSDTAVRRGLDGRVVAWERTSEPACRWCYGRPMPEHEVCSRRDCIVNWSAVAALYEGKNS